MILNDPLPPNLRTPESRATKATRLLPRSFLDGEAKREVWHLDDVGYSRITESRIQTQPPYVNLHFSLEGALDQLKTVVLNASVGMVREDLNSDHIVKNTLLESSGRKTSQTWAYVNIRNSSLQPVYYNIAPKITEHKAFPVLSSFVEDLKTNGIRVESTHLGI